MSFGKTITLATDAKLPQIGLGTWLSEPKEVEFAVEHAIRNGYRHLDLAMIYGNQHEVGAALKKVIPSVVKREELFITSKLWNSSHRASEAEKELNETLRLLGVEYLDLYLIHWPAPFIPGKGMNPLHPTIPGEVALDTETSLAETWRVMMNLPKTKVHAIGVSNFTVDYLKGIIAATGVVPVVNQIEAHPLLPQDELVAYCKEQGIKITAYSPLGNNLIGKPRLTDNSVVQQVATKLGATPAQVLIAWGVYRGYSVIPKSVQAERIVSNFQQVELSKEDYEAISAIGHGNYTRYNIPYTYGLKWNLNIFDEPVEKSASFKVKI